MCLKKLNESWHTPDWLIRQKSCSSSSMIPYFLSLYINHCIQTELCDVGQRDTNFSTYDATLMIAYERIKALCLPCKHCLKEIFWKVDHSKALIRINSQISKSDWEWNIISPWDLQPSESPSCLFLPTSASATVATSDGLGQFSIRGRGFSRGWGSGHRRFVSNILRKQVILEDCCWNKYHNFAQLALQNKKGDGRAFITHGILSNFHGSCNPIYQWMSCGASSFILNFNGWIWTNYLSMVYQWQYIKFSMSVKIR